MPPKKSRIKVEYGNEVSIVVFGDENLLEEYQIRQIEDALLPVVDANEHRKLVLNFENTHVMSSAFLRLLVKVHKRVVESGGQLQLLNLAPKILRVFKITRLTEVFEIA